MKLNLDFYKEKQESLSPIEKEILEQYLLPNTPESYEEILKRDTRVEVALVLSPIRENILNWYDFSKDASILQIGANMGEITGLLCKKANKVVALEENLQKAKGMAKRYEKEDRLEIIVGELGNIILESKFDYVLLEKPEDITFAKKWVKEDGVLLLLTNNRFGISYFAGASYEGEVYHTFLNEKGSLYGKKEIEELLEQQELRDYQFYYPLPNYKMPNVIFSEQYMPNENTTKLMYNIMYEKGSVVVFDELKALKQITKNHLFDVFANSFFVEIRMPENTKRNEICFVSFNNNRKQEYQLATIIYRDKVMKRRMNAKAKNHIKNIELNTKNLKKLGFCMVDEIKKEEIISPYIEGDTFDGLVAKLLLRGQIEQACIMIEKWYNYIKERLLKNKFAQFNENIVANPEELEGLTILKNGYIDLVFENTFYQNDTFLFFDQEWYEDSIPLEFLLYRAIGNLYAYNVEIEKICPKQEILNKFQLEKYVEVFNRIEEYIQKKIIDETMIKLNQKSLEKLYDIKQTSNLLNQIADFAENDKKQNQYIQSLETDNQNKQNYIEVLERRIKELEEKE